MTMAGKSTFEELEYLIQELEQEKVKRKRAEKALRDIDNRYRGVVEDMPALVCCFLPGGEITFVNKSYCEYFGKTSEELIGSSFLSLIPKAEQKTVMENISTLTVESPTQSHEHLVIAPNGSVRWQRWNNRALFDGLGEIVSYQSIGSDITEQKQVERALKESEERYRNIFDNALVGLYRSRIMDGKIVMANNRMAEIFGYESPEECVAKYVATEHYVYPELREKLVEIISNHGKVTNFEAPIRRDDGSVIWLQFSGTLSSEKGFFEGVCTDITEQKRAKEALRESKERLQNLVNKAVMGIYQVTHDGEFLLVNPKFSQMFGFNSPEEFLSSVENISQLYVHPEERSSILKKIRDRNFIDGVEIQFWNRDGQIITNRVSVRVIEDKAKGPIYEGFMADLTDQKRLEEVLRDSEERLARSKKMESLGLLAGGVAHDLNNVLSGVVSIPDLLLMDLPQNSKLREPIETIQESGNRAAAIVQDLLTVARGVAITKEPLNLNDIVNDYLISPEFKKLEYFHPTVTVKTNLDTDLFNIDGSHVHIGKVVMNLVSNAAEAIGGEGNVTISTMNRYVDRPQGGFDDVKVGEYVVLSVSDDGSGISSEDLKRIFEPFYTKKVMGRSGTGLGLAVVWNTLQDHRGRIDVTSDENGTTFELYFPITRDEISGKVLSVPIKDYKGNGETILVVDDVESQREISCKMLDTLGYKTKAVCSGEEAVEYLKKNNVDLLLLDMIMDPGINGRETYERIIEIHPSQKAIILSGFVETDEVKKAQKLGAGRYIMKPATLEKIGLAVKGELEK